MIMLLLILRFIQGAPEPWTLAESVIFAASANNYNMPSRKISAHVWAA